jgi:cell shape-determining protein MreC
MGAFVEGKIDFKAGYDPRIKKYYELLEENEALRKKISFLQQRLNESELRYENAYWFGF